MCDWANAIRPYNFSHHSVGANRIRPPFIFAPICIRPCLYSSMFIFIQLLFVYIIISLNKCPLGECDSPLHWHAYIYLFRIPYGQIAFAPNQHSPQFSFILIYIFHHFIHSNGRIRFAPTLAHIYFHIPCGRIAFAPISIRPIYFPTTSRINLKTPLHTPQKT